MTAAARGLGEEGLPDRLVRLDPPGLAGAGASAPPLVLDRQAPFRIGRDPACALSLPEEAGLSRLHAELRPDPAGGWWLHDLGSRNGTYLEGERLQAGRRLRHGDRFRLGGRGPLLQFLEGESEAGRSGAASGRAALAPPPPAPASLPSTPVAPSAVAAPSSPSASPSLAGSVAVAGNQVPLEQIRSVELRSEAWYPQLFSWWVLGCLGGLLMLPFPWIFWPWQVGGLALALALARRQEHTLLVTLRDGRAHRHRFTDRATAQAHHRGLLRSLGQRPGP